MFCEENKDLDDDTPKEAKCLKNPSTLVFTYTPVDGATVYESQFKPFLDYLGKCIGKRVVYFPLQFNEPEIEAMRAGQYLSEGLRPQVEPAFWAIALFRGDISVRDSAVLGLVGAGGIGMAIDTAMNLFQRERVALMLLAIFAPVIAAELVVTYIRKKLI